MMNTGRREIRITMSPQVSRAEDGCAVLFGPFDSGSGGARRKRRAPACLLFSAFAVSMLLLSTAHAAGVETNKTQAAAERKDPRQHWAFKPPVRPPAPAVKNKLWARNPIDGFVLARLEKEKLKPSAETDKVTLL